MKSRTMQEFSGGLFEMRNRASSGQGDLFERDDENAEDDSCENPRSPVYVADPDEVRADLQKILDEARSAETMPWDERHVLLYRTIFPQMTNWLPAEEAAQLRQEFAAELARLESADSGSL